MGRKTETITPGPGASNSIVTFTLYNDTTHTTFTSQPIVLPARTTWLDPNDPSVASLGGTTAYVDAIGRTIATQDALFQSGGNTGTACAPLTTQTASWTTPQTQATACTIYGYGASGVSGDSNSYTTTTVIDANSHEVQSYIDALGRTIYAVAYSGLAGGTLTAVYNVLDKPTSITATDLSPQANQTVISVTTTASYDSLGQLTSLADPDRGTRTSTYDADGRMTSDTSGSRVIGTSYDLLGRIGCLQNALVSTITATGACDSGTTPYQVNTYNADPSGVSWSSTSSPKGKLTQSVTYTYFPSPDNAVGTVTENHAYDQRGK